jgi:uncharacterized protein (DUF2236 family)
VGDDAGSAPKPPLNAVRAPPVLEALVREADLEAEIERLRAEVRAPEHGLFGPGSVTWRISRDSVVFLGAGRAALLQLAHPYVAHAIEQHSETRRDPIGRFNRTFLHVYGMIFGDLDAATSAARRVRRIHDRVSGVIDEDVGRFPRGHAYTAHEAGALLWVFATLIETGVMAYEMGFGPLSAADREAHYQEARRFARLFGLGDALLPQDWAAFEAYCAAVHAGDELSVGRPAREIARFLLAPPSLPFRPAARWYRMLTAGMLPQRVRAAFGLRFSKADAIAYRASLRALRLGWQRVPERLRLRPEYVEATRRIAGKPARDRFGRALEHALLLGIRPRPSA